MARLVPMDDTRQLRVPGQGKGQWKVSRSFDDALPADVLNSFEQS